MFEHGDWIICMDQAALGCFDMRICERICDSTEAEGCVAEKRLNWHGNLLHVSKKTASNCE